PRGLLLRHPARPRGRRVALRGVRARRVARPHRPAGGRPVRRRPRARRRRGGRPVSPTTSLPDTLTLTGAGGPGWAADVVAETATPTPSDDPLREDLEPTDVSPGLVGFLAIFAVALAAVGLFFGLSRQLRRMRHNAEVQGIGADGPLDESGTDDATGTAPGTGDGAPREGAPGDGAPGAGPGGRD